MEEITVYYAGTKYQKLAYMGTIIGIVLCTVYIMMSKKSEELNSAA